MKKLILCFATALLLLAFTSGQLKAATKTVLPTTTEIRTDKAAEANALIRRLHEIKAMDKSAMTSVQKKELRSEVLSIKRELNNGGGVYLSVGAVIIIILLLILLL